MCLPEKPQQMVGRWYINILLYTIYCLSPGSTTLQWRLYGIPEKYALWTSHLELECLLIISEKPSATYILSKGCFSTGKPKQCFRHARDDEGKFHLLNNLSTLSQTRSTFWTLYCSMIIELLFFVLAFFLLLKSLLTNYHIIVNFLMSAFLTLQNIFLNFKFFYFQPSFFNIKKYTIIKSKLNVFNEMFLFNDFR